ncbi:MAG: 2-phospho-L-lactate transferase [Microlunatus sp.]|nr:2-phospho-L-lactate transferase [Microlunatus sp.]MDN5769918.1 2-phospho-L-lactate transferase [Microlunatus sp.]
MQVVVLGGGVGGSRFVSGVRAGYPDAELTVVVNTADDITLHGLRICPDLDTMAYTLGGGIDTDRGWGRAAETWRVSAELAAYGLEPAWFGLGDLDLATHIARTQLLAAGHSLSEVTRLITARWLGHDPRLRLLPMTDDVVETEVMIFDPSGENERRWVHFQEYWVRLHAEPEALAIRRTGIDHTRPAPGVAKAIATADLVLIAPSNPVVSIGPILEVPGIRDSLRTTSAPVIGFAGILGGAPVLGMADRLLPAIGVAVDAAAVGRHYGSRVGGGVLDLWVMDTADGASAAELERSGLNVAVTGLIMTTPEATAEFIRLAVKAVV